jgi:hypothetical protein
MASVKMKRLSKRQREHETSYVRMTNRINGHLHMLTVVWKIRQTFSKLGSRNRSVKKASEFIDFFRKRCDAESVVTGI